MFHKKNFLKLGELMSPLKTKTKEIVDFYSNVHSYSTSDEYRMHCLVLFESESVFLCYSLHSNFLY